MQIITIPCGPVMANSYIVRQEGSPTCAVIDPADAKLIFDRLQKEGLTCTHILLTHGHFDHGGDADRVRRLTGAPVYLHPADRALPSWLTHGLTADRELADGDELDFDGLRFKVLHTPGHTPGSVCFLCGDALFAGDTLFAGSCGRTDLPGGSWKTLAASLRRLAELEGDYTVLPGHGEATTLSEERESNPFMEMALREK